ncbi:MAG: glycosyltransferase family 2 protein [Candidatus Bathyarchaeia archaeon]
MEKGVSIVVVTHNRQKDVTETIESLLNQSLKPIEIVVIDDGSNPPLNIKYRVKELKIIRLNEEVGACNARNFGVRLARGGLCGFYR